MKHRPLSGIRVVDLAVERGELCGRLLSDLGAEVIRVEPPNGSDSRSLPPLVGDHSLFFTFRNAGKLSVGLDLSITKDVERFEELLAHSDVLIDSAEPGTRDDSLSPETIAKRHPHLIVTSITAYGRTGPYAGRDVPNAVLDATGGMAFKAGAADREPLLPPGNVADDTASMHGVFAIECALLQQIETGAGQLIDLSVNEACAQIADWSLSNWTRSLDAGSPSLDSRIGPGPVYTILPCLDGYVRLVIIAPRHWKAMRAWLGEPDYLQEPEYETFMGRFGIADAILNPLYTELFSTMTMLEVSEQCQDRGIVCTPILKPSDVLANPHFEARGSFDQVKLDGGTSTMSLASGFFEINGARIGPTGPPPAVPGQDTKTVFASLGDPRPAPESTPSGRPLAELKVMDFGHGGVGVEASRLLAEYGADVVKIESRSYPDFIRVVLGGEMSPSFATSSRSKRSVGVDAKSPEGAKFLRRMARRADIAIENNSTGIMDSMGLGFADLHAENPALTMMSSQLMGSRGPWATWSGYGPNTQVTGGMTHLWNYEGDDAPAGSMSIFPDHFAGRTGAVAALAGVLGRKLHGDQGIHVEVCQVEQVINVMADLLAKESLDPGSVVARGNHNDRGTPWGLYQCVDGDNWVAICTRNDRDWRGLAEAMGSPEWAMTDEFAVVAGRRERENEIDALISAWTGVHSVAYVVDACLTEGVPAGPMLNSEGQYHDAHLRARGFVVELDQPPIGKMTFEGPAFQATGMDGPDIRPAPGLGAHTREVAKETGYDDDEIDELLAAGVLELDHPEP